MLRSLELSDGFLSSRCARPLAVARRAGQFLCNGVQVLGTGPIFDACARRRGRLGLALFSFCFGLKTQQLAEVLLSAPFKDILLVLQKRKRLFRLALQHGAALVSLVLRLPFSTVLETNRLLSSFPS